MDGQRADTAGKYSSLPADRISATLALDTPVTEVSGVSAARARGLAKRAIYSTRDLLSNYPRRYLDMSRVSTIVDAPLGEGSTILGSIYKIELKQPRPHLQLTEITVVDDTGTLIVTCFRQPWIARRYHQDDRVAVSGKVEFNYGFRRMTNPNIELIEDHVDEQQGIIIPVHPTTSSISGAWMRRLVGNALDRCAGIDDPLPLSLRLKYRLHSRQCALQAIHFPYTMDEAVQARRRLSYDEVLLLELRLLSQRAQWQAQHHPTSHVVDGVHLKSLEAAIPFTYTDEQKAARDDILAALAAPRSAKHLVLGDVGCGKTILAACALATCADTGTQGMMMGPTEVLVSQYARSIGPLFDQANISWAVLTGSTSNEERAHLTARFASGDLDILMGTHVLLEKDVCPQSCSLVVIDEQQRFGVDQRAALEAKGDGADVLSLTATPIPRSLALALYGDTTLSYIHERPFAHEPTVTQVFSHSRRNEAYDVAREALTAGQQVYIVCPLIGRRDSPSDATEESYAYADISIESYDDIQDDNPRAARAETAQLRKVFAGYRVEMLHGHMKSEQKQETMDAFLAGDINVLVATTVIEVGVDVPNATVMIIEDADRFGLAQLHQLRGRVGRGTLAGHVCLVSGSKAPTALKRLSAMENISDGFSLAEYDLSLRREGDILGNRQHGASSLKLVNIARDARMIEAAHDDARAIIDVDPDLSEVDHRALRHEVEMIFGSPGKEIS